MPNRLVTAACMSAALFALPSCTASNSGSKSDDVSVTRSVGYVCNDGQQIRATYLEYRGGLATFVVLEWNGNEYGLARAISASGARYASLYGPTTGDYGLEWWEGHGEARLGTFTGKDFSEVRPLLAACKPQP
jgi:membrane-bound inhibitor of C-type lysozyme